MHVSPHPYCRAFRTAVLASMDRTLAAVAEALGGLGLDAHRLQRLCHQVRGPVGVGWVGGRRQLQLGL